MIIPSNMVDTIESVGTRYGDGVPRTFDTVFKTVSAIPLSETSNPQ